MRSVSLKLHRVELFNALATLGVARRQRFSPVLPVWLNFVAEESSLHIVEGGGIVTASVPAIGERPLAGSTIDLYLLKRTLERIATDVVQLHALEDAVLLVSGRLHVKLSLLGFGPETRLPGEPNDMHPLADLPLFRWASQQR